MLPCRRVNGRADRVIAPADWQICPFPGLITGISGILDRPVAERLAMKVRSRSGLSLFAMLPCILLTGVACLPADDDPLALTACRPLTVEEEAVIAFKATEPRFVGEYVDTHDDGIYHCRRCGQVLYESMFKFDAGSGWPAFDRAIEGTVSETPDADGRRTEITCSYCGGHLGHIFRGEGFTPTNTRHCVNSVSLKLLPSDPAAFETNMEFLDTRCQFAYFAGGDFRVLEFCTEDLPGVIKSEVGLMGGDIDNPDFTDVQIGSTGHVETVRVEFDQSRTTFSRLAAIFFRDYDHSVESGRYRSAIFFVSNEQQLLAQGLLQDLQADGHHVLTSIEPARHFWMAPVIWQNFYQAQVFQPDCVE